jgi:hypothetical protein
MGFNKSEVDPKLYFILVGEDPLKFFMHVVDLFLTDVEEIIASCKEYLSNELEMKDIVLIHYLLGLEVC